jgi:hypothetical protein
MKIDGFTYVRNGVKMGYPFISSIKSLLPLVEKLFIAVGDSEDETKELIQNINDSKIQIIDTVWDEEKRKNGEIFRDQANIALNNTTADWCFHLQVDEVLKEDCYDEIFKFFEMADKLDDVDGLLFPFLHFWGDYYHIRNTRRTHAYEIRAFKNHRNILSYKDSQGFRKYGNISFDDKGTKLKVLKTPVPIYHYSYTRNPALMKKKTNYFHQFWHDDTWLKEQTNELDFDFNNVDKLALFHGNHPVYMKEVIAKKDWDFEYDPSMSNMSTKDRLLNKIEELFNYRLFEYRNYEIIRLPKAHDSFPKNSSD